jgi:adenylylsulfate kinase
MVVWLTGLSGSGKTTFARALLKRIKPIQPATVHVDGDMVRDIIQDSNVAHDRESRLVNAYRICRMAKVLEQQGLLVVVSTMSLFHEIHDWNRKNFDEYFEILIHVDKELLKKRDARAIYTSLDSGKVKNVGGFDLAIEEPKTPDLVVDNNEHQKLHENVESIVKAIESSLKMT